jgi:hypothetical protein
LSSRVFGQLRLRLQPACSSFRAFHPIRAQHFRIVPKGSLLAHQSLASLSLSLRTLIAPPLSLRNFVSSSRTNKTLLLCPPL